MQAQAVSCSLRLVADGRFGGERLMGTCTRGSPPIVVCDRIPKDAVEPRDCALVVTDLGTMLHGFQVRRLEDVLGNSPVFNAGRQKAQKLSRVVRQ
jgi:hypothetical protein